jgi:hypothetical protein
MAARKSLSERGLLLVLRPEVTNFPSNRPKIFSIRTIYNTKNRSIGVKENIYSSFIHNNTRFVPNNRVPKHSELQKLSIILQKAQPILARAS